MSYCYSTANVCGEGGNIGGVIGMWDTDAPLTCCYSTGNVTGTGTGANAGGVVGDCHYSNTQISNCYATGNVYGAASAGGIAGDFSAAGSISNSVALAQSVKTETSGYAGRVLGDGSCTLTNNYARADMQLLRGATSVSVTPNANEPDGDSTSGFNNYAFWDGLGYFTSGAWEWSASANLPVLKNMPQF